MTNAYSRRYEVDSDKGVYDKLANSQNLKKIHGEIGDPLLIRGNSENLLLIERKNNKEILKIHSKELEAMQSELEKITGVALSQYRIH